MGEEMRTESGQGRRTWLGDGEGMVGRKSQWVCHRPSEAGASASPGPLLLGSAGQWRRRALIARPHASCP